MKNRKKNYFVPVFMTLCFLSAGSTAFASSNKIKEDKMRVQEDVVESVSDTRKIRAIVESTDENGKTRYQDYYGGMYLDEKEQIVVLLCNPTDSIKETLQNATESELLFETVEYSYESLTEEMDKMTQLLMDLSKKNEAGLLEEGSTEKMLFTNIVMMYSDVKRNRNMVGMLDISPEMQELFHSYFHMTMGEFQQISQAELLQEEVDGKQKQPQKIQVKKRSKTYKSKELEKKSRTFKLSTSAKGNAAVTFQKVSGSKKLSIGKHTGKITVKKGTKKGNYQMKVKIKVAETKEYFGGSITKTITVKVK